MPTGVLLFHLHAHHDDTRDHRLHDDGDSDDAPNHAGDDMYIHLLPQLRKMKKCDK